MQIITAYLTGVPFALLALALLLIAYWASAVQLGGSVAERLMNGNGAIALRQAGMMVGLGLALSHYLAGPAGVDVSKDLLTTAVDGLLMTALLLAAAMVDERLILPIIDNRKSLQDGNLAVGLVELGHLTATGLVASGAFSGESGSMATVLVFFLLGQTGLVITGTITRRWLQLESTIAAGNISAGLKLSGTLLAMGIIMGRAVSGPSLGWETDLLGFAVSLGIGLPLLLLSVWLIDLVLLPKRVLREIIHEDRNIGAVVVAVAAEIGVAITIAGAVL